MIVFSKVFYGLFADKQAPPAVTLVQTALEPIHEEDVSQAGEFLDDFSSLEEQPGDETK